MTAWDMTHDRGWVNIPEIELALTTDNPEIANWNGGLTVTAFAPGFTGLVATWSEYFGHPEPIGADLSECVYEEGTAECNASMEVQCQVPSSEVTITGGWHSDILRSTKFQWNMTLGPLSTNFAGRQVTEETPLPSTGQDTCWLQGSQKDPFDKVTGSTWTVRSGNTWGPDSIGYSVVQVDFYRAQGRAPCSTRFTQQMLINCGSEKRKYKEHQVGADIGTSTEPGKVTLKSIRAGQTSPPKTWP